jgi:hypothetical protein
VNLDTKLAQQKFRDWVLECAEKNRMGSRLEDGRHTYIIGRKGLWATKLPYDEKSSFIAAW